MFLHVPRTINTHTSASFPAPTNEEQGARRMPQGQSNFPKSPKEDTFVLIYQYFFNKINYYPYNATKQ